MDKLLASNKILVIPTIVFASRRERNEKWRDLLFVFTLSSLALGLPLLAPAQKNTADLPAGPMAAKAATACTECHEARIILQQRLGKPAWTKEVYKMMKWGAVVDAADRDGLIDYLSTNFSPDKPAYEPSRTAHRNSSGKTSR